MTHEEQVLWKLVEGSGLMWKGSYLRGKWCWSIGPSAFRWDTFREHYETFRQVAEGLLPKSKLPTWQENEPKPFDDDLDGDIPF